MKRYAIITRVGAEDKSKIKIPRDTNVTIELPVYNSNIPAAKRVNHQDIFNHIKRLGLEVPELAIDLLFIAFTMYTADQRIERAETSQDGWTREIDLYIPVSNSDLWNINKNLLEQIFHFLTGDIWRLFFRSRHDNYDTISPTTDKKTPYHTSTVCLFSGGLDSYIGAINLLEDSIRPILLGHHTGHIESTPQILSFNNIKNHYKNEAPEFIYAYVVAPKKEVFGNVFEDTSRGRSFLFFSLGVTFASALKSTSKLIIPENGLISLNVPLTSTRVGALSTRTTHPFYMAQFQKLIDSLGLKVILENPFRFKTKGEMLLECSNQALIKKTASDTMSCAHSAVKRWRKGPKSHCGYCVPCIIRQAAFKKAFHSDTTVYDPGILKRKLDSKMNEGKDIRAYKIALARIATRPDSVRFLVHKSGPLNDEPSLLDNYADVYRRGMEEVGILLKDVDV